MEPVLTAPPKSPPNTPSSAEVAAGREDQSDFWTADPNSIRKASASSTSVASMVNDGEGEGEGVSEATSMTRLSSTTSLALGLGLAAAGGSRRASSRDLAPEEIRLCRVDHFQVEELSSSPASRPLSEKSALSRAASLEGERRSLMGGQESPSEVAARGSGNYGTMVDSGEDDEKSTT